MAKTKVTKKKAAKKPLFVAHLFIRDCFNYIQSYSGSTEKKALDKAIQEADSDEEYIVLFGSGIILTQPKSPNHIVLPAELKEFGL